MRPTVYLAGPISGCTYDGCTEWREYAAKRLAGYGIAGVDPLRGKQYLAGLPAMPKDYAHPMSTAKGIVGRDRFDCSRASLVLVNFDDAIKVSIGTVWEIGVADANRIPYIVIMGADNVHQHPMIVEAAYAVVETLDEALDLVIKFLKPYA